MSNILFIVKYALHPNRGGLERVTIQLGSRFASDGHRVFFLSCLHDMVGLTHQYYLPESDDYLSSRNVSFLSSLLIDKQIDIIINQQSDIPQIPLLCRNSLHGLACKVISVLHFDPHHYEKLFHVPFRDLRYSQLPISQQFVFFLRSSYFYQARLRRYFSQAFRSVFDHSDAMVLLSDFARAPFESMLGCNGNGRLHIISNPLTNRSEPEGVIKKHSNMLLWVGRLSYLEKRPDLMLRIWQRVSPLFPDWSLTLIGDGDYMPQLRKMISQLHLKNVNLLGQTDPDPYYSQADILCLTSATEGFSLVVLEAAVHHVPAIAFDSYSAIRTVISDESGCLVPAFDIDAYAETLIGLMRGSQTRQRMGDKAYLHSRSFDMDAISAQWYQLFDQL